MALNILFAPYRAPRVCGGKWTRRSKHERRFATCQKPAKEKVKMRHGWLDFFGYLALSITATMLVGCFAASTMWALEKVLRACKAYGLFIEFALERMRKRDK
jgi:VanZ family protein